ncbi:RNA-directed DNA polymerase [Actimicrobium sp. CCI2.3]|uniref:RNA-directed DNA polymerase n=1 Tax=Actimicrobium sp. CCI2.3 TaxID=3048616 RepID=UPI002AB42110|nr:RNA-directed DNA polymerase [Actimicrobium sp. CCI2.3]MDY7573081.1 RNA-directed DNA polymerase [Actimicrobium sp. CCI2.3]MEB0020878.1 RNA-directed DNA polymerase [Actimicrobium sp. CCI2.3]
MSSKTPPPEFNLFDLGMAYRKAKVDLYYSTNSQPNEIAKYEDDLEANLQALLTKLNGADEDWVKAKDFIGDWTLVPKSLKAPELGNDVKNGVLFSSPADEWKHLCKLGEGKKPKAVFRLMAQASLDFHVLSTLWVLRVGHQYDIQLTDCAYGNRLRRGLDKEINPLSLGTFSPYLKPFRDWRDNGIGAMRTALEAGKKIVALTADVTGFYHELNPAFMLEDSFNELFQLDLSLDEQKLHRLFISALQAWAETTPLKRGLPVGLPASAVVANIALIELDQLIQRQVVPLYYGRYVDDLILVMENGSNIQSTEQLWDWLFVRSGKLLNWLPSEKGTTVEFTPKYLHGSQIQFANDKNKVFVLTGETGKTLVESIARQIHERASEWRALPNLPRSAGHVATDLVAATQSDGQIADNLRKADLLSMRRAGFAIKLRDFEAYERDLHPDAWKDHRRAFFRAVIQHVLVLPHFFDLSIYIPRVVKIATACEDFEDLRKIMDGLSQICKTVGDQCKVSIKPSPGRNSPSESEILSRWKLQVFKAVNESIVAAFPPRLSKVGKRAWETHFSKSDFEIGKMPIKNIQAKQAWLFSHDLAHMPFRFIGLPIEMIAQRGIPAKKTIIYLDGAIDLLSDSVTDGIAALARWIKCTRLEALPIGLLFATRPSSVAELFILDRNPFSVASEKAMRDIVLATRGFTLSEKMPRLDRKDVLQIPDGEPQHKTIIAVSSWETRYKSWVAAVTGNTDPDFDRYARLNRLVKHLISQPNGAKYFILPELALPAHWFMRLALKLQGRGISLITGIEYLHASKSRVRNQVWAALSHDGLGFPSMLVYRQDKQRPALHELQEIKRLAGLELNPEKPWTKPPVIQHGTFRFAMLVCSELTNISYRTALRGEVDALFIPEWNQDTETFNSLVESAALDVHAYIIQCNDRQYGDSRIRAPYKDTWRRDILKVKGGIEDYCVTGEIDILALRQFQSSHRSPDRPFKPVPDGFKMGFERRALPIDKEASR